jgi:dihydrolipoamide dehydrogenase
MQKIDVAIIGAGTAGLTARREVMKKTDSYLVFDPGPLGTTCARVGCMPSKALIQVAQDFSSRKRFEKEGILGQSHLSIDPERVMKFVRELRDFFVSSTIKPMKNWEKKFVSSRVKFLNPHQLQDDSGKIYEFKEAILACGTRPRRIETSSKAFLTTDEIFEIEELTKRLAVIGTGVIGLELGQAFQDLGVQVHFFTHSKHKKIGPFLDPVTLNCCDEIFRKKLSFQVFCENNNWDQYDCVLEAVGRESLLSEMNLQATGVTLDERGRAQYDEATLQLKDASHLFLAGDCTGERMILHEAADEGRIAGLNVLQPKPQGYCRRTPLTIVFSHPQMALVGCSYEKLPPNHFVGEVSFAQQGRSRIKGENEGILRIYGAQSGQILGAEMIGPVAENISHFLASFVAQKLTVQEALFLPFYHPVVEEGVRTALRDLKQKIPSQVNLFEIPKFHN